MFLTENKNTSTKGNFDWEKFFSQPLDVIENDYEFNDAKELINRARTHLKENVIQMTFVLVKMIRNLFENANMPANPRILELGAGTGFLTKCLIEQYDGRGFLVDNNPNSFESFRRINDNCSGEITYVIKDIFEYDTLEKFDISCSFGLIEHFPDKSSVIEVHKKFLKKDGYTLILVPLDTQLTRVFFDVYPELNLGYRELLTEGEFRSILNKEKLKILNVQISRGYSYDFIAALCKTVL